MDIYIPTMTVLSLFFMIFGCAKSTPDLNQLSIEEIAVLIHEEVGQAEADSVDRCDMIPIGVKPAGGPWGYLVFSTEHTERERIEELVERYNELDAERNEESGGFSTADVATEPNLILRNGSCYGDGQYALNPEDILDFNDIEID